MWRAFAPVGKPVRRRVQGFVVAGSLLAAPALADPPPRVYRILRPLDGQGVVLITNRGFIFADPGGNDFRLMCNQALRFSEGDVPTVASLSDGRLIATTTDGLRASSDSGCAWQGIEPFGSTQTNVLAQHPEQPDTLYVAAFGPGVSGIHVTRNKGETWTKVLGVTDNDFIHSLLIAAADPQRVYAAVISIGDGAFSHALLRSADAGTTWGQLPIQLGAADERATVLAVHPANADEVLMKTTAFNPELTPERLLLSRNGGETFTTAFLGTSLSDGSYSADAAHVWVADNAGLWRSADGLASFERLGATRWISYAKQHEGRLWVGGQFEGVAANKDGIGISSDGGLSFSSWMDFQNVDEQVACSPQSRTVLACEQPWAHWQVEVLSGIDAGASGGTGGTRDGGEAAGGNGGGGATAGNGSSGGAGDSASGGSGDSRPGGESGCGCRQTAGKGLKELGLISFAALFLLRSFRRRNTR